MASASSQRQSVVPQSARQHFLAEIRQGPAGQRDARVHGKFARDPLDFNDDVGGKRALQSLRTRMEGANG
jgi:hypothetical protein